MTLQRDPAISQIWHHPFGAFSQKSLVGISKESTNAPPWEVISILIVVTCRSPQCQVPNLTVKCPLLPLASLLSSLPNPLDPRFPLHHYNSLSFHTCAPVRSWGRRKGFKVDGSGNFAIRLDCTWKWPRRLWDLLEISLWMRNNG